MAYIQSRLLAATAQVHRADTADDVTSVVLMVMDPEVGLLDRLTAFLDTASQRLDALAEVDLLPARPPMAAALQAASAQLTTVGYLLAEADLARPEESAEQPTVPTAARASAALARTAPAGPPPTATPNPAPALAAGSVRGAAR
ncbi:hypothetical protein [Kitasatospora sp. HPMI-4]|uniref:hypothetical protein n=1 Tax=Kitasatospora sp. HPMI-4 TaxID=3448443 RepID=UPI003F1DF77F